MNCARSCVWLCGAIFALTAQSPAPSLPSAPLRHLEYTYAVDYQSMGSIDTGEISATAGAATQSYTGGSGRQGKMFVDILAVAKDGGLLVRAAEWPDTEPKAQQAFTCAVYPDTRVLCGGSLPVTDAETTLMTFLARNFVDPNAIDANNHWQQQYSNQYVRSVADFTVTSTANDGKLATILGHSTVKSVNGANRDWTDDSKIVYDLTKEVPTSVHVVSKQAARGSHSYSSTMDFTLTEDSL
jgi:hypothetical protein